MQTTQLKTTQLGQTGLEITRVGFGAWAIGGGGWEFGWGPQQDEQSIAAIQRALELGRQLDRHRRRLRLRPFRGDRRAGACGRRERPYVFTKASLLEGPGRRVVHSLKRDSILREAHASLERLGVDAIDLYQIHWPIPEQDIEEGWSAFAELKEQGLVRHIGVSNFDVEQLRRIQQIAPVETLQPQYSLIERDIEGEILPFAEREGIGVIVYSPMGSGLLTGAMTRERIAEMPDDDWRKQDPASVSRSSRATSSSSSASASVADRHDTPGAVGDRLDASQPGGGRRDRRFRSPEQVDPLIDAANSSSHERTSPRSKRAVTMQTIGFIGLGNMGGNMAARYLAAGYTVYGEARDRDAPRPRRSKACSGSTRPARSRRRLTSF